MNSPFPTSARQHRGKLPGNVNHFCAASAEMRVLLQESLYQAELCGISKPKFKIPGTRVIATHGSVEELQCSLLTLLNPAALYQQ